MIRHRDMFRVCLIITALCLGTLSEAGNKCLWCNEKVSQLFLNCMTGKMVDNPNFEASASSIEEMKNDLLQASKAITNNGPTKESVMKGAMAYALANFCYKYGNLDQIINIIQGCYGIVKIRPDRVYFDELVETIKNILAENGNPPNAQQSKNETQSDEIPQAGQNTNPSQNYNAIPQQAAVGPNQGQNQLDGLLGKNQQQGQNFQPNLSQGSANTLAFSTANAYGTLEQQPVPPNNAYLWNGQQPVPPNNAYFWNAQPPVPPNNAYLLTQQNQPFIPLNPYNQPYNSQGNPNAYQNAYQNYPLSNANINTGANGASPVYQYNGPQSYKGYNQPYSGLSASTAFQTAYNGNNPVFYTGTASSASSSATNDGGSNAAASSSGSYSNVNSNQKPLLSVSPPQNQQNIWDNNQNLYPVMQNTSITQPEPVKTNPVPQQPIPIATQNATQYNNSKIINQQNLPSTKNDKVTKALKFSETLYIIFVYDDCFKEVFHPYTTKQQLTTVVPYLLYNASISCGYDEKTSQELATSCISFTDGFPVGSPTSSYAEAFCKMLMVLFDAKNMIGDDPHGQATALGNAMSVALKKIVSPPPLQDNDTKPVVLPTSQQNLLDYPTKNVPYDDRYPNFYAANPQVKPNSFSNKQLNQQPDLLKKGSDNSFPQTLPIQNQQNQPNVYYNNDQPTDDKAISYDKSTNNKTYKKADQSYADADGKSGDNFDDNCDDDSPGQSQIQNDDDYDSADYFPYDDYYYYPYDDTDYGSDNPNTESKDGDINPNDYLIKKNAPKNNKQADNYPDTVYVPGDNSKTVPKSMEQKQQQNKSTPQHFSDSDKDGGQNPTTQLPYIFDDQQTSTPPDIGQKNNKAPIIPNTLKDSDNQTILSTDAPVFQPNISDNSMNPDLKNAQNVESKDRVKILEKWALDCIKDGKFDYKIFSSVIAELAKFAQKTNPSWSPQKSQTTVLIEAIFGLTQLLLKSNVKKLKDIIQQPQKSVEPVQLPPNSQQNNQNVQPQNQNLNYQTGQTNANSQPVIQDNPAVDYLAPEQSIVYSPQDQGTEQTKGGNNQNPYPVIQNTPVTQPKLMNTNSVPQQTIPIDSQYAAQDNNWNIGNQMWQNNLGQTSNNNANFQQVVQQPFIPGQINKNQGNGILNDQKLSNPQAVNSNAGVSDINNFQYPLGNQAILPDVQKSDLSYLQNGNQGRWSYAKSSATASSVQSGNQEFTGAQGNLSPVIPNDPSLKQNGNQGFPGALGNRPPILRIRPNNPSSVQNGNQGFTEGQGNWASVIPNNPNNPNLGQNGNQGFLGTLGNWPPVSNGPSNPSFVRNTNQEFTGGQGNSALSNGPSNPTFLQNGYQGNWGALQQNDIRQPGK